MPPITVSGFTVPLLWRESGKSRQTFASSWIKASAAPDVSCGADSVSQHFAVCVFSTASVLEPSCDWQDTARGPHGCPAARSTRCCPSMSMVTATTFFNDRIVTGHAWKWPETGFQTIEEGSSEEPQGPHWPQPPCMSPGTPMGPLTSRVL